MRAVCLALLLASGAWAQSRGLAGGGLTGPSVPSVSGGYVPFSAYATPGTGAQTYYVNGTLGSDSNACRSAGAGACATIQGALNKVPKLLRDLVTVSIAAGNYTGFYVSGFAFDPGVQQSNGGLLIDGALANSSLTGSTDGGSATGTATSAVQGSGSTFGTLTKAAANWTINDLRGRFITIGSGTGNGQLYVISSNTATVITIVGTWGTTPDNTSVFAVKDSSVIINAGVSIPPSPTAAAVGVPYATWISDNALNYIGGGFGAFGVSSGALTLQNLKISGIRGVGITDSTSLLLNQVQVLNDNAVSLDGFGGQAVSANIQLNLVYVNAALGGALNNSGSLAVPVQITNSMFDSASYTYDGPGIVMFINSEAYLADDVALAIQNGSLSVSGSRISCNGVGRVAIANVLDAQPISSAPQPITQVSVDTTAIGTNCSYGVVMSGPGASATVAALSGTVGTTGLDARLGGLIQYTAGTTLIGTTQDISVEAGAITAGLADVSSGKCLTSLSYVSRVCKQ